MCKFCAKRVLLNARVCVKEREHCAEFVGSKRNKFLEVLGVKLGLVLRATYGAIRCVTFVFLSVVQNGMVNRLVINNATHRRGGKEHCRYKKHDMLRNCFHSC